MSLIPQSAKRDSWAEGWRARWDERGGGCFYTPRAGHSGASAFNGCKVGYKSVFGGVGTRGKIRVKVFHSPSPPNTTPFHEWGDSYSKDNG
ncbi:hypothetical protein CEXT_419101 [Caerostris extrusa]|uniref:Uncharacterized protein n=1 Tax=Caerostris extrusa TaxID=172846 RepID=A0AAV4UVD7_CAEEX|nr:hypothetical protein CEXT_419101 [Caerostris extrusa]